MRLEAILSGSGATELTFLHRFVKVSHEAAPTATSAKLAIPSPIKPSTFETTVLLPEAFLGRLGTTIFAISYAERGFGKAAK
jgi:hypothetical protein